MTIWPSPSQGRSGDGTGRGREGGPRDGGIVKAVLGPTNTGKTHLAIERMIAHSSGAIGFPLRLLAREVYDKVRAIKGDSRVALITGEERIEPKDARWLLCTAEAMPSRRDLAFVALDEAQIGADPERGHIFTDRLLHTRGREETLLLGSATIAPLVRTLLPEAEIVTRPRFSTLSHTGSHKLSRIPPRSAIVAFSAEQVYAVAEMLRRFRGGAAVVMGALSPQTRNAQVDLFQSGEVDYIVATDAIGMGLNLDIGHVAFAGLSKYDGHRQRRLTPAEMAQIAGRAGRHQRDGTFGTLSGGAGAGAGGSNPEFTPEEVYAIEEHRFAPLTRLYWREADPRFDSVATLIADLEVPPNDPALAPAPPAIDLAVLKALTEDGDIARTISGPALVKRFWAACSLPDFRKLGSDQHARFVARLWQDLGTGNGHVGGDYIAQAIAQLDHTGGDIDTLQQRIAAIRSWAYIAQRPDWVLARDEMAARARAAEARLSDALHARLTERFVNRRTTVLMRKLGADAALLPVRQRDDGVVTVDDEPIGKLAGFRFEVDPAARAGDRKLLLAAAERHLPELLADRAKALLGGIEAIAIEPGGELRWQGESIARLERGRTLLTPRTALDPALTRLDPARRGAIQEALERMVASRIGRQLMPLVAIEGVARDIQAGAALRALALRLVEAGGVLPRGSTLEPLLPAQRERLRALGVRSGALDLFHPGLLKSAPLTLWAALARVWGVAAPAPSETLPPVLRLAGPFAAYRTLGGESLRVDSAEKLLRAAHGKRITAPRRRYALDPALAVSMGLSTAGYARLLRLAGFEVRPPRPLTAERFGPPAPPLWQWRPPRIRDTAAPALPQRPSREAFAALSAWAAG
jgi:ATP-dependent RNA helicase SUPV3L1/SUV3